MMLGSQSSFLLVKSKAVNRSERARSLDSAYARSHLVPPTANKYEDCKKCRFPALRITGSSPHSCWCRKTISSWCNPTVSDL